MTADDAFNPQAWPTLREARFVTGGTSGIIRQCLSGQARYYGLPCPTEVERLVMRGHGTRTQHRGPTRRRALK